VETRRPTILKAFLFAQALAEIPKDFSTIGYFSGCQGIKA
jgi:hypothetical protein